MFREKNVWNVTLTAVESGQSIAVKFASYWDPQKVSNEFVGASAAAEAFIAHDKQLHFMPTGVELVS